MPFPYKLLLASSASGSGKTTVTAALIAALQRRHLVVQACKVGPDFIDTSHHALLSKRPSYNLDAWMGTNASHHNGMLHVYKRMVRLQSQHPAHVLLAEGAMGLFDGALGIGGPGSSAHVARTCTLPVVLILDVRRMGQSAAALALGFLRAQSNITFAGIICNHVGSEQHKEILKEAFDTLLETGDPPILGYLSRHSTPQLPSRHLGLRMGHECAYSHEAKKAMADWIEKHVDIDALLHRCAQYKTPLPCAQLEKQRASNAFTHTTTPLPTKKTCHKPLIAIAHDDAFSFLYADMHAVLEELGAKCVFFSPLDDKKLPAHASSLYLPGGYPELYATHLANNTSMLHAVRDFVTQQKKVYAECGGFMYLLKSITHEERTVHMTQVLPYTATIGTKRAALGYRHVELAHSKDIENSKASIEGRGHEFHYGFLNETPTLPPLWHVHDRQGRPVSAREACGVRHGNVWASWIHLYPEGARSLLKQIFRL